MQWPTSLETLIEQAEKDKLYKSLVQQLNKDLNLANIDVNFPTDVSPIKLMEAFQKLIKQLMETDFNTYLNLLYIIDVSEARIKAVKEIDIEPLSGKVSFLMLQRVWKKVWYRNQLS